MEEPALRLADMIQLMSRLHCDETGLGIHCSAEPIQAEALQHMSKECKPKYISHFCEKQINKW